LLICLLIGRVVALPVDGGFDTEVSDAHQNVWRKKRQFSTLFPFARRLRIFNLFMKRAADSAGGGIRNCRPPSCGHEPPDLLFGKMLAEQFRQE